MALLVTGAAALIRGRWNDFRHGLEDGGRSRHSFTHTRLCSCVPPQRFVLLTSPMLVVTETKLEVVVSEFAQAVSEETRGLCWRSVEEAPLACLRRRGQGIKTFESVA